MSNQLHLQRSVKNVQGLIRDIERGYHIPIKFRAAGFTDETRSHYLTYLRGELERLQKLKEGAK